MRASVGVFVEPVAGVAQGAGRLHHRARRAGDGARADADDRAIVRCGHRADVVETRLRDGGGLVRVGFEVWLAHGAIAEAFVEGGDAGEEERDAPCLLGASARWRRA